MILSAETAAAYDRIAERYSARWSSRDHMAEARQRFLGSLYGPAVADLGCGPGRDMAAFHAANARPVGVDRSRVMTARAAEYGPVVRADLRALPFRAKAFDGLWACASLLHVPPAEMPAVLGECARVLRPGGVMFLSVKEGDGEEWTAEPEGVRRYFAYWRPEPMVRLLLAAGFAPYRAEWAEDHAGRPVRWLSWDALRLSA